MTLGAFQPTLSERPLLRDCIEELQAADNIDRVFLILTSRGYMSFFSYHIIECIINAFGVQQDKENLRDYTTKFNEYSKRSIFECPAYSLARKDQANLVVKIEGVNFEECNLSHLAAFKSRISDIINVTDSTLRLCTVEKGCVQLTFQMPHFVKEVVFPLSESQKAALRVEGVTRLTCEDYQCPLEISETDSTMSSTCAADQALEKLSDQLQPETKDTPAPLPAESLPNPQGSSMPLSPPCLVIMGVCV